MKVYCSCSGTKEQVLNVEEQFLEGIYNPDFIQDESIEDDSTNGVHSDKCHAPIKRKKAIDVCKVIEISLQLLLIQNLEYNLKMILIICLYYHLCYLDMW